MKKFLIAAAACVAAGVAFFSFHRPGQSPLPENPPGSVDSPRTSVPSVSATATPASVAAAIPATTADQPASSAASAPQPQDLSARAGEYVPSKTAPDSSLPPEIALQNVRRVVHQYGDMFGGNPVGTNPEITAALSGQNPKKINFLAAQDGMRVNDKGELVDPWGTPYFFHQVSSTEMEIHSAGPDKMMWTSDDLVTR